MCILKGFAEELIMLKNMLLFVKTNSYNDLKQVVSTFVKCVRHVPQRTVLDQVYTYLI